MNSFELADHIKVTGASFKNGMLDIDLEREIPDALKPRKISIQSDATAALDDSSVEKPQPTASKVA